MPRKPRFYLPGIPAHIVQRGNSRQAVFFADDDYTAYMRWLHEACLKHGCQLHAYVLMTNHVHLLMTPHSRDSISRAIQYTGRFYVSYVNRCYGKSGTLWEGRHKGCLISDDRYLLACMRYIELNPVRAGIVMGPADYAWSSYHGNAMGKTCEMLQPHEVYLSLGATPSMRQLAYRALFGQALDREVVEDVRATVQTGTPLGNARFREQIERTLHCSAGYPRRGRPVKTEKGY